MAYLRWMPPQALAISNDTKESHIFNSCAQQTDSGFLRTGACLILNLYASDNANNLLVYVWIYRSGFYAGAAAQYNPTPFVSTSIINSVPIVIR